MFKYKGLAWLLVFILVAGCDGKKSLKSPVSLVPLEKLSARSYPQFFDTQGYEDLNVSIDQSLVYFNRVPRTRTYTYGKEKFDAAHIDGY